MIDLTPEQSGILQKALDGVDGYRLTIGPITWHSSDPTQSPFVTLSPREPEADQPIEVPAK